MSVLLLLIPVTLLMGIVALGAFFWSVRTGQYEDLAGDSARILFDEDRPLNPEHLPQRSNDRARETRT